MTEAVYGCCIMQCEVEPHQSLRAVMLVLCVLRTLLLAFGSGRLIAADVADCCSVLTETLLWLGWSVILGCSAIPGLDGGQAIPVIELAGGLPMLWRPSLGRCYWHLDGFLTGGGSGSSC
ncbi:hypothetical protein Nepgr_023904 [Nepenthes gracilis]|uniref:Uncharacterized protein n=1 Tax=Nepenthes gracilis TaxID=150966 RepID=A0AAD3T3P8_NEPGR|nr:hypothetical protein Nepgr_023904 [Nepenthes gracilis]